MPSIWPQWGGNGASGGRRAEILQLGSRKNFREHAILTLRSGRAITAGGEERPMRLATGETEKPDPTAGGGRAARLADHRWAVAQDPRLTAWSANCSIRSQEGRGHEDEDQRSSWRIAWRRLGRRILAGLLLAGRKPPTMAHRKPAGHGRYGGHRGPTGEERL